MKKYLAVVVFILFIGLSATPGIYANVSIEIVELIEEDDIDRWGVIIGISDYKGDENDLHSPAPNAQALNKILKEKNSHWNDDNIQLLIDNAATKENVIEALDWLIDNADSNDIVLFYFNGHGDYIVDTNGDELDGKDEVILTWELDIITDDTLGQKFDEINNKNITGMYLIIDSCFSGGLIDPIGILSDKSSLSKEVSIYALLSETYCFSAELASDISADNRIVLVSTIPHGISYAYHGIDGWFSFSTGVCNAVERGIRTAEGASFYAILVWFLKPIRYLVYLFPDFWIDIILSLLIGIFPFPIPMYIDGYPSDKPRSARLFLI